MPMEQKRLADLAAGRAHATSHTWRDWTVTTRAAPIVRSSKLSVSPYSHGAWQRELGLTLYAGQHLPAALHGASALILRHEPSGVCISFCALEALRAWALLQHAPVPHLSARAAPPEWDYSFTTAYAGATTRSSGAAAQPDGRSLHARPAVELASGPARLRRPLCKCVNTYGCLKLPAAAVADPAAAAAVAALPPPPEWQPSDEVLDFAALASAATAPHFVDIVPLWRDDQDPHSLSTLTAKVLVADDFILAYLRCFVRVNGVRARVVDTRYVLRAGGRVLRERSWREGSWEDLAGVGAPPCVDFGGADDVVAAAKLPLQRPPVTEELVLPSVIADTSPETPPAWQRELRCEALCARGGTAVAVSDEGATVEAIDAATGHPRWSRPAPAAAVAAALAPSSGDGGRLALGLGDGSVNVWREATGEPLLCFALSPGGGVTLAAGGAQQADRWVERLAWSGDGRLLGAAMGRTVAVAAADSGAVERSVVVDGTVYAVAFADGGRAPLAVGAYGGLSWLAPSDAPPPPPLPIGAAAVLSVAVSPDATLVAAGCLDKRVRVFEIGGDAVRGARDWVGFDGSVHSVAWSATGRWLAAAGGTTLLVVPRDLAAGEPPTVCDAADGGRCPRFDAFAWSPSVHTESLLAALAARSGAAYLFDARRADGAVPRVAVPIATVRPPAAVPSALGHVAFAAEAEADDARTILLVALGDWLVGAAVVS